MAGLAANEAFLSIGGTDVSGYATKAKFTLNGEEQSTTAGFTTDWTSASLGLLTAAFEAEIVYDASGISGYVAKLQPGVYRVIWCPNGNVAGQPKHEQDVLITSCDGPEVTVEKTLLSFSIKGNSTGTPQTNMYNNGQVT